VLETRLAEALGSAYTIEGEIGRGGMGVVYRARDERLKRPVAIKVLPPELAYRQDIRTRFMREAETAARLSHPHIVPIHSVGDSHDLVYFVMGYVDGESLGVRVKRRGRLSIGAGSPIEKKGGGRKRIPCCPGETGSAPESGPDRPSRRGGAAPAPRPGRNAGIAG